MHTAPLALPPEHDPSPGWGQSLAAGAAGIAPLHIAHAHTGVGDWVTAHRWTRAMIREPDSAPAVLWSRLRTTFERHSHRRKWLPCDGLLEGAADIALTRHTTTDPPTDPPTIPGWDAYLLITPPPVQGCIRKESDDPRDRH